MNQFVIARKIDGRAVMEGSHACSVRWGIDPQRVRAYGTEVEAHQSIELLCDAEDAPYVCDVDAWCRAQALAFDGRIFAMLSAGELEAFQFHRARGRKYGALITIISKADPALLASAKTDAQADAIMRTANSVVSVELLVKNLSL